MNTLSPNALIANAVTQLRDDVYNAHEMAQFIHLDDETLTRLVNAWTQLDAIRTRLIQEDSDEEREIAAAYLDAGRKLVAAIRTRIDAIVFRGPRR